MKISIKPVHLFLLTMALLALAGCSLPKFAYEQAPGYVADKIDEAFDLDESQSAVLDERLQRFFVWHRQQELRQYREVLQRAVRDSSDGVRADEFMRLQQEVRAAWGRVVEKAIDSFGDLALTLTPAQIDSYEDYWNRRSRKYAEYREMTAQQRETYRVERNFERLEDWFGDFDDFKAERVRERLRRLPDNYESWIRYREARHQALIAALRDAQHGNLDLARLKTVMLGEDTDYARVYEPSRQAYWQAFAAAFEDISGWVDARQRQRLVSKLEDYARIVDDLEQS